MEIELQNALLRPWTMRDFSSLTLHANNIKIANNLRDGFPHPYSESDAKTWLKSAIFSTNLLLAVDINGEAVGGVGIIYKDDVYRKTAEVGYWLSEEHWNKGIISEAISSLVKFTFENTEVIRIFAGIFENNLASSKVLEKCGFKREAVHKNAVIKNGIILDEVVYAILKI